MHDNTVVVTLAVGDRKWGDMALNLALSIKAQTPEQKTMLIYSMSAAAGLEPLLEKFFDYGLIVYDEGYEKPHEQAYAIKTRLYAMCTQAVPDATQFIFMDADTIMIAGRTTSEWFEKHEGKPFTAYCNDMYDYDSKKRLRKDYTFWCDPEDMRPLIHGEKGRKMPQINSSFLYFEKCHVAQQFFDTATRIWGNEELKFQKYRGAKPDEFCFNVAALITNTLPHQNTYRPTFFQFATATHSIEYILHYYKSFGFAGEQLPLNYIVSFYNQLTAYYREHFGIVPQFKVQIELKRATDLTPILLSAKRKRTLFRAGEVENSNAGIFNPDGLYLRDKTVTIFRKEANWDVYKGRYAGNTAIPHLVTLGDTETIEELKIEGYPARARVEDFRLFSSNQAIMCNHKIVFHDNTSERDMKTCLGYITEGKLCNLGIPALPIEHKKTDINWMFFAESDKLYCVYQLQPLTIFVSYAKDSWQVWEKVEIPNLEMDWFHKGAYICNSTNPILIDKHYLMFFHTKEHGVYYHGAVLLNRQSKQIEYYTKNSFHIPFRNDGMHKDLMYISGSCYNFREDTVRVFYGENDSHACYIDFDSQQLINAIKENHASSGI